MRAGMMRWAVVLVGMIWWVQAASASTPMPVFGGWVIETADYTGTLQEQIVRLQARYTIRVTADGAVEIPLPLEGATVTGLQVKKKVGDAHIEPRGDAYVLVASKKGVYQVEITCAAPLQQDTQLEGVRIGIPQATFSTLSLFVPRKDVELRPADQLYVERKRDGQRGGIELIARLGASQQIDLRWSTKPAAPLVAAPVLYGETHTLVTIEEQLARILALIDYRMVQGETKTLQLELPLTMNVLNVRGAGIEEWKATDSDGHRLLTVALTAPLKDAAYRLVLEAEEPIGADASAYALPDIRLVAVKQERGELAVARTGNIELAPGVIEGLVRIDIKELAEALQAQVPAGPVLAFRYHQHPYRASLTLTRHQDHPVLSAIAEQGELITVVSRQGELMTRAVYLIKANKKQFIGVTLPEGGTLWSCLVNGASVKPAQGEGGQLLVPLDAARDSAEAVTVELVYFEQRPPLTGIARLNLRGPRLDVPVTVANWRVLTPQQLKPVWFGGNLEQGATPMAFLDDAPVVVASRPASSGEGFLEDRRAVNQAVSEQEEPASLAAKASNGLARMVAGVWGGRTDEDESVREVVSRLQDTGVLPLKIRLPKTGTVRAFHRLMTTGEAMELRGTFVHVPSPWLPMAGFGLLVTPLGALGMARLRRRTT